MCTCYYYDIYYGGKERLSEGTCHYYGIYIIVEGTMYGTCYYYSVYMVQKERPMAPATYVLYDISKLWKLRLTRAPAVFKICMKGFP
jgi:hypothetical protein